MKQTYQIQIYYKDYWCLPDGTLTKRVIEDELSLVELLNKYVLLKPITIDNYKNYQCPDVIKNDDLIEKVVLLKIIQDSEGFHSFNLFWKCQTFSTNYIEDIIKQEMENGVNS